METDKEPGKLIISLEDLKYDNVRICRKIMDLDGEMGFLYIDIPFAFLDSDSKAIKESLTAAEDHSLSERLKRKGNEG